MSTKKDPIEEAIEEINAMYRRTAAIWVTRLQHKMPAEQAMRHAATQLRILAEQPIIDEIERLKTSTEK